MLAVDYSGSTQDIRRQLLSASHELATDLDARKSSLFLFRFGHTVEEIYSGVPDDEDSFALILSRALNESDPMKGTQYPKMLQALADRAAVAREGRIRIIIAGDGMNDFTGDKRLAKLYRAAAKSLASNPNVVSVRFWGVQIGAREEIRAIFKGYDSKLQFRSIDQSIAE
jgi:hypothetical protein